MARSSASQGGGAANAGGRLRVRDVGLDGWIKIIRRVGHEALRDHVFIASAGIAFLAIFALLPLLTALISIYGVVTSPQALQQQLDALSSIAPHGVVKVVHQAMRGIVRDSGFKLGFGIVISIGIALWVTVRGVLGLIGALNLVHQEDEKRSAPRLIGTATALAVGALIFWILALFMIVGAPLLAGQVHLDSTTAHIATTVVRWLIIVAAALVSMAFLYRYGPSHAHPRWKWLSTGSMLATALWLAGSLGLSFYSAHMGSFGNLYGSLGILMVVQLWFFLTAFVFLLGAEFNIEIGRELKGDTRD
jgi:membrane protein